MSGLLKALCEVGKCPDGGPIDWFIWVPVGIAVLAFFFVIAGGPIWVRGKIWEIRNRRKS